IQSSRSIAVNIQTSTQIYYIRKTYVDLSFDTEKFDLIIFVAVIYKVKTERSLIVIDEERYSLQGLIHHLSLISKSCSCITLYSSIDIHTLNLILESLVWSKIRVQLCQLFI